MSQAPDRWYNRGVAALEQADYEKAINYFQWSVDHGGGWESRLALADCYRDRMKYDQARRWYATVCEEPQAPVETSFHFAQCLLACNEPEQAQKWFSIYAQRAPESPRAAIFRDIEHLVAAARGDSLRYTLERLPINSSVDDFSPLPYQNGLLFVSARKREVGVRHSSTMNEHPLLDIYFAEVDSVAQWSRPRPNAALNSKLNEGPMALDPQSGMVLITRNDLRHRRSTRGKRHLKLNRLHIEVLPQSLSGARLDSLFPIHDKTYAVGHPAMDATGSVLYFVSDMPGGMGGTDIYRCRRLGKAWSAPENLGPTVNSEGDEMFPYVDPAGKLYFASNGHLGLGGLDIFLTQQKSTGEWTRVENLGYPFNSTLDDFGVIVDATGDRGYLSSNRNLATNDDIYQFRREWPDFKCIPMERSNYCFTYSDDAVLDFDTMPLAYEWNFGDGTKARGLEVRHCYDGPGDYEIELNIVDTVGKFVFLNQSGYLLKVRDPEQVTITAPDTVLLGEDVHFSGAKSIVRDCAIQDYYWEFGDGSRARGTEVAHAYAELGTYEVRLGVRGPSSEDSPGGCRHCTTRPVVVVNALAHVADRPHEQHQASEDQGSDSGQMPMSAQLKRIIRDGKMLLEIKELSPAHVPASQATGTWHELHQISEVRDFHPKIFAEDSVAAAQQEENVRHKWMESVQVIVVDTLPTGQKITRVLRIPAKSAAPGVAQLLAGTMQDAQGRPIPATMTFAELDQATVEQQQLNDSMASVRILLPDGREFRWQSELENFMTTSSYMELTSVPTYLKSDFVPQKHFMDRVLTSLAETGEAVRLDNIYFDFDSDRLRAASVPQITRLAQLMREHPKYLVEINAHTDNVGDDGYNLDLSRRRAAAVVAELIHQGIAQKRLKSQGYGESLPVIPNDTPEHRQLNRRVEFKIVGESEEVK